MKLKLRKDRYTILSFEVRRYDRYGVHIAFRAIHEATQLDTTGNIVTHHNLKNGFQAGESALANTATREFATRLIENLTSGSQSSVTNLIRDYNDSLQIECSARRFIQVPINVHIDVANKHIKKVLREKHIANWKNNSYLNSNSHKRAMLQSRNGVQCSPKIS